MSTGIPPLEPSGDLPPGVYPCGLDEVESSFGDATETRRRLMERLRDWVQLARSVGATRTILGGSFASTKPHPGDVDLVVLLPDDFLDRVRAGDQDAVRLHRIMTLRDPGDLLPAFGNASLDRWCDFLSRPRSPEGDERGLLEIVV